MTGHDITLCGARLTLMGSGALWWEETGVLAVADLHFGKAERMARRGGVLLPPYETRATLDRLAAVVAALRPARVLCLGDSFEDDAAAEALPAEAQAALARLTDGRDWTWVGGNHDARMGEETVAIGPLLFRHIATGARGEVSGHWHPKLRVSLGGRAVTRACFLADARQVILPAFGTYTGGLHADAPPLAGRMGPGAIAVLTGPTPCAVPLARVPA